MLPNLWGITWRGAPLVDFTADHVSYPHKFWLDVAHGDGPLNACELAPALEDFISTLLLKRTPNESRHFHADSILSKEVFIHTTQLLNPVVRGMRTDTTEPDVPLPTSTFPSLEPLGVDVTNTLDEGLDELVKARPKLESLYLERFPSSHPTKDIIKSLVSIAHTSEGPLCIFVECPVRDIIFGPCSTPSETQGAVDLC